MLNNPVLKRPLLNTGLKHLVRKAPLAALALALFTGLSCGKRTPPQPPSERVNQRVELTGFQRGNQVILSWKMPARNAAKSSVLNVDRIDIYRLAEPASSSLTMSEEEFSSRSTIIATLAVKNTDFGLQTLSYPDKLEFAGQAARLRYAMRFANASGQKAGFSNFFLIEPASRMAAGPTYLSADYSQDSVDLKWLPSTTNVDGSSPANLLGYNVYRSTSEKEPAKLLNKTPVAANSFRDEFFDFGKEYFYFVRAVSIGTNATPVESQESNILKLKPVDTFAPSPPSAITLAVGQNVISLFFAVNPEKDVAGYRIYRSVDPDLAKTDWMLITPELLTANTFQDTRIESGKTYYYYLTAADKNGNISESSEVVSETVK